jgi:phosphohistidine phosphatase SixA
MTTSVRHVLLIRHASHDDGRLNAEGKAECAEVSRALVETLTQLLAHLPGGPLSERVAVLSSESSEAVETASLLVQALDATNNTLTAPKTPNLSNPIEGAFATKAQYRHHAQKAIKEIAEQERAVVIAVSHMPLLAWLSNEITGKPMPMARAEVLALEATLDRGRLRGIASWALTPRKHSQTLIAELRDKITSKMEAAKYLGAFVTATLGVQLALLADPAKLDAVRADVGQTGSALLAIAAALLVLSSGLFFMTVFAYDKLLMPPALWTESGANYAKTGALRRPPSSALWVLLRNMQNTWWRIFTPGVVFLVAALALETLAVVRKRIDLTAIPPVIWIVGGVILLLVAHLVWLGWPRLGSDD